MMCAMVYCVNVILVQVRVQYILGETKLPQSCGQNYGLCTRMRQALESVCVLCGMLTCHVFLSLNL